MNTLQSDTTKSMAREIFDHVRNQMVDTLHRLEDLAAPPLYSGSAGRITLTPWQRDDKQSDLGGGQMGLLAGRLFEKAGVHVSEVHGPVPQSLSQTLPGQSDRFWASGVSVIIHPRSPHIPSAHMNLRMIETDHFFFGGGADLTPMLTRQRTGTNDDSTAFHAAMERACAHHPHADHQSLKKQCDQYFYLPHRNQPRGLGGIFFDRFASDNTNADLAFLREVGEQFSDCYESIVRQRMLQSWNSTDRKEQLGWRGRYAEFNLLYDRGTRFGLLSGGNVDSILSSLPPLVAWT